LQFSEYINASDWGEIVSRLGGSVFHSSVWAEYSRAVQTNLSPLYITCSNDQGVVVGAALAFVENSSNRIIDLFSKRMLLHATPLVKGDDTILATFLVELEKYCRRKGFVQLSISSYASPDISNQLIKGDYDLTYRYEFTLDLNQSEEELRRGFDKSLRWSTNKAIKSGVTIHEMPVEESIASLEKLGKEAADRVLLRKGVDLHRSGTGTVKPAVIIVEAGLGRFFSAVFDGEIVSTSLFTLFNGIVYHMLSGANDTALKTNASKLLLWHAIKSYREAGARIFNLGGCKADATEPESSEHGVYRFKKNFGAHLVKCASGEKILGVKRARFIKLVKSIAGK